MYEIVIDTPVNCAIVNFMRMITKKELYGLLRRLCREAGSQRAWAEENGIDESVVSRVMNGDREFTDDMLKAMKVKLVRVYEIED